MYKLYFFNDFESVTDEILASFCSILPVERQERIKRYRRQIDKKLSAVSYIILLYALAKDYGIKYPDISIGTHGKPYLTDYPDIHFNISHCVKGCVCAVSDVPIGVDIQEIRLYSSEIAERVCSAEEMKIINNSSDISCFNSSFEVAAFTSSLDDVIDNEMLEKLVKENYSSEFGARPARKAVSKYIEDLILNLRGTSNDIR